MKPIELTEEMFKSGQPISQGEVLIWMEKYAPQSVLDSVANLKNLEPLNLESGQMIMGHSETGHHHVIEPVAKNTKIDDVVQALIDKANDTFIKLTLADQCLLVHLRTNDTHGSYLLPPGEYIRGIREEQTIEGWRRVED